MDNSGTDYYDTSDGDFSIAYLALESNLTNAFPGDTLTLHTHAHSFAEGAPAALFITAINGNPVFIYMIGGSINSLGVWVTSFTVPFGWTGRTVTGRSYAYELGKGIVQSNDVTVVFQ